MKINAAGLELLKSFEGLRLTAYKDPVGILTIGYGHTGPDLKDGQEITNDQATELLKNDVSGAEIGVARILNRIGQEVNPNQFSALVSIAYNIGVGRLATSSIIDALDNGETLEAANNFLKYVFAKGVRLSGLVRRRTAERGLFLA